MIGALLLLGCIIAEVAKELCFKAAAGRVDEAASARDWRRLVANGLLWAGIAIWAVETLAWITTLRTIPLGVAYPVTALSYALAPLVGWWLLKERLKGVQIAGVALVTLGVACVGLSGM